MKQKRSARGRGTTRRLVALSAAVATAMTVARSVNWQAVGQSVGRLHQGSELVEELVRQELVRPVAQGTALTVWEQMVVAESPQLLNGRSAVDDQIAREEAAQAARLRARRERAAARQAAEGERQREEKRKEAERAKKAEEVREAKKAAAAQKKKGTKDNAIDISDVTASDIELDNHTDSISVDVSDYFDRKPDLTLKPAKKGAQILIMHTHTTEAYHKGKKDTYRESDVDRTTDEEFNVVRIGEEMKEVFEEMGLSVVHDKTKYDYPSYTGSYNRALDGIQKELDRHPTIQIVLDVHRDSVIGSDGKNYAKRTEVDGETAAQVMLVVGTDDMGLTHPNWKNHLALAVQIQKRMLGIEETFPRPIDLRRQRFNEHMTPGSLLVEVGTDGNSLKEAIRGARLFARAAGSVYLRHVAKK